MSRLRRVGVSAVVVAACVAVLAAAWVLGGNAVAARRERDASRAFEAAFGPFSDLVRRYTVAESNASARRVEELAKDIGFDLSLRHGGTRAPGPLTEGERDALRAYVDGELTRSTGAPLPPPTGVAALLASRRAALSDFEELLSSAPPPRWACDVSGNPEDWPWLPLGSHLHLQRLLVADALVSSSKGLDADAARALEASWALNQALAARAVFTSQMIATAIGRFQAGALRRVGGSARVWSPRLAEMGSRRRLVDALVLEHGDVRESWTRLRRLMAKDRSAWAAPIAPIREVRERLWSAGYARLWAREIAALRDATPFTETGPDRPPKTPEEIIFAIAIPNIRNAFARADRLALDAELTGKILRMEETRRASGTWPPASPEIAGSRLPGLSWDYRLAAGAMSISLSREVPDPFPKNSLVLPLSFSSGAPRP